MHVLLPLLLIGVPVVLMGLSFPYLQKAAHANYSRVGRRIGILMAANIAGSTIGASATGLLLLSWLGSAATLKLLVATGLIPAALLMRAAYGRRGGLLRAAPVGALVVTFALMPDGATLWATLHGTEATQVLIAEDGSGLSVIRASPEGFAKQSVVYVNGASQGRIPFGDIHTVLGAMPLLIHPSPADVLIIGLGSGDTCFSAAGRPTVQRLACVEIIGKQRSALDALVRLGGAAGPAALFADRRVEHIVADGRAYLMRSTRRYDIIEADALRPVSAYSGNLYSVEYFTLLKRYLKPNGLAVTWAPTDRVRATFRHVFPHVLTLDGDQVYIGSNEPIRFDPDEIRRRAASAPVREYYSRGGVDISSLIDERLMRPATVYGPDDERPGPDNLNSDLWPRDEYALPDILPF
jgi:spermidine synthase